MLLANPWALCTLGALLVAAIGGTGWQGYRMGRDSVIAKQARDDQIRFETLQLAQLAAAEEIAKISETHTTIRQKTEVITREVPIYRDCVNDPRVVSLLDAARANQPGAVTPGGGELPTTGASSTREFW